MTEEKTQGEGSLKRSNTGNFLPVALLVLIVTIGGIVLDNQNGIDTNNDQLVRTQKELTLTQEEMYQSQLDACDRGNDTRVQTIQNFKKDISVLRANIRFGSSLASGPDVDEWIETNRRAIRAKEATIVSLILSIKPVASDIHPQIVDCIKAYKR